NERCFVFSFRQPLYRFERRGEDTLARSAVKSPNHPILARAANCAQQARTSLVVWFMEHNGATHPASAKNRKHGDSSERKSAPGPGERGVLQENPLAAPARAFTLESPQRANPADFRPWNAYLFQL